MKLDISEEKSVNLDEYAQVSISFEVRRVLDVEAIDGGLGGFTLSERELELPYLKDYDAIESPLVWPQSFDMSNWGFLVARSEGVRVGGATVAFDTAGVEMLENRKDLAVLWDIRIAREARSQGVGAALFRAVEKWAAARGCLRLKVETQNINVPACKFYSKQRCVLGSIHRFAYPELPEETQLLWYKDLRNVSI